MTVNVRGVKLEVRSVNLTKALLKQVRRFQGDPSRPYVIPPLSEAEEARLDEINSKIGASEEEKEEAKRLLDKLNHTHSRVNPEYTVGWIRGSVLDAEYEDFVLFAKDGDLFLWAVARSTLKRVIGKDVKQIYI